MAENPLSNCSSATSVGDSEPSLKRMLSTYPGNNTSSTTPPPSTPIKPIINLIPAEEPTISPKRSRFIEESDSPPLVHKKSNSSSLVPPTPERLSIVVTQADPPVLTSAPSIAPTLTTQALPSTLNIFQNTMGTSNSTLPQPSPQGSTLFSSIKPVNLNTNFQGVSVNGQSIMKLSQKQARIFGNIIQGEVGCYKSEQEKEKILFGFDKNEVRAEKNEAVDSILKDPHGLNWLSGTLTDTKGQADTTGKKKLMKTEKNLIKKKVEEKNPFELALPRTLTFSVFNNKRKTREIINEPVFTLEDDLICTKEIKHKPEHQKINTLTTNSIHQIRIPLKPGYSTFPDIESLKSLTSSELESIYPLSISNEHGKILFLKPINLLSINFSEDLTINKGSISVYPNKKLPAKNKGFNTSAEITLYNCKPLKPVPIGDFISILRTLCTNFNSKFISWNPSTGDWVFAVDNFEAFN